jgi:hypothetical protein
LNGRPPTRSAQKSCDFARSSGVRTARRFRFRLPLVSLGSTVQGTIWNCVEPGPGSERIPLVYLVPWLRTAGSSGSGTGGSRRSVVILGGRVVTPNRPCWALDAARGKLLRRLGGVSRRRLMCPSVPPDVRAIDYQIARRIGYWIGWAGWSPFIGATHEAGPVSRTPRGVEVEVVACHHHDRARLSFRSLAADRLPAAACIPLAFRMRSPRPNGAHCAARCQ